MAVSGVTIGGEALTLATGDTEEIVYTIAPPNADDTEVLFDSDDETVATVSDEGVVTAVSEGTATITVTTHDGGFTDSIDITVEDPIVDVTGVSITSIDFELDIGETDTVEYTVSPTTATDNSVTFDSSDDLVATVSDVGLITAIGVGTAVITITTTDGDFTDTVGVTVASGT